MKKNKVLKILIRKTDKCDTRTNTRDFTVADVESDTIKHINAVKECGKFLSEFMQSQFADHDHTKLGEYLPSFYEALKTGFKGKEFNGLDWWDVHKNSERHHLNDRCPDDVNLIDVLEMVCDCVCAGKARTGTVYPIAISPEILQKAVANTQKLLESNIIVIEDEAHSPTSEELEEMFRGEDK